MKMSIIADAEGNILGSAFLRPGKIAGDESPSQVGLVPLEGQSVYEVDAPDEVLRLDSAAEFHQKFRLKRQPATVEVVKIEAV